MAAFGAKSMAAFGAKSMAALGRCEWLQGVCPAAKVERTTGGFETI
jgi:hypothetical protein